MQVSKYININISLEVISMVKENGKALGSFDNSIDRFKIGLDRGAKLVSLVGSYEVSRDLHLYRLIYEVKLGI